MRMQEAAKVLGGSIVVYVVMAACAARGGNPGFGDDGGPEANNSNGGGSSGGGAGGESNGNGTGSASGSDGSNVFDALTDPVPEANAQALPPITATESCNKTVPYMDGGVTYAYAEHAFPGYLAQQLARVVVLATWPSNPLSAVGYSQLALSPYVRDGYVAATCGNTEGTISTTSFPSVTFILPQ